MGPQELKEVKCFLELPLHEQQKWTSFLIMSPKLTNENEKYKYKIPEIVLQQPDDWQFYLFKNDFYQSSSTFRYDNLTKCKDVLFYIKDDFLIANDKHTKEDHTIQYQIVRVKQTVQKEKTPLEKLTEKVEQLTEKIQYLTDELDELKK